MNTRTLPSHRAEQGGFVMEPRLHNAVDAIARYRPLDKIAKPLKKSAEKVIKPGTVKDLLAGTWL